MKNTFRVIIVFPFLIALICCNGNDERKSNKAKNQNTAEFNLTGNDQMQYNLNIMTVVEGSQIKIYFENIGKMPVETMGHNFLLLKPNVDIASFAAKAFAAKETEYIPEDELGNIIVYSNLLGPGEKTIIEFTAPSKGIYKYICSFPGHYSSMQGKLIVR